jgi:tripartite-type tricarboxylate transporter receptor subunit TctC
MMSTNISRQSMALALTMVVALHATFAIAADTTKPLHAVLPVGPGSGVDTIVRSMGPSLTRALGGQSVVIENLPGAGGITGTQAIVKAAPDGQTIGVVSNNHVINPSVYKSMPYDSLKDITPISVVGNTPFVVVVNPKKLPVGDLKGLVAALKAKPNEYNYASSGNGTVLHLAAEMLLDEANVKSTHVPYKGVGPMVTDLMGGQVDWGVVSVPSVQGHLKTGALKAIAIPSPARIPQLPEVPTSGEQGYPNFLIDGWFAVIGPAKLPPAEVKRIYDAVVATSHAPEVKEAMDKQGNVLNPMTPETSAAFMKSEQERYAKLVKKANVKVE